jgi:hypothetical protein
MGRCVLCVASHFNNDKSLYKVADAMPFNGVYSAVPTSSWESDGNRVAVCPSKLMILIGRLRSRIASPIFRQLAQAVLL